MKKLLPILFLLALPFMASAQRQNFLLPSYFATNVFLSDNTNTPLHTRIQSVEQTNTDVWASFPATTNINAASNSINNISEAGFITSPTGTVSPRRLQWNADRATLQIGLNDNVNLDVGQQSVVFAKSIETNQINKGEVVLVLGSSGDNPTIKRASNVSEALSARTIGLAAENITSNNNGFVVTGGTIYNINTTNFTQGAQLYLGANGTLQTNLPAAPLHGVFIGTVERVGANNGQIYVHIQNYQELDELSDVNVSSRTTNDLLIYNGIIWTNYSANNLVTTNNLSTIAGSGLGVVSNTLVATNVPSLGFTVEATNTTANSRSHSIFFKSYSGTISGRTGELYAASIGMVDTPSIYWNGNELRTGSDPVWISQFSTNSTGTFSGPTIQSLSITNINTLSFGQYQADVSFSYEQWHRNELRRDGLYRQTYTRTTPGGSFATGSVSAVFFWTNILHTGNFSPSTYVTVSAGNTNYLRRTSTYPTNFNASGSFNQFATLPAGPTSMWLAVFNHHSNEWHEVLMHRVTPK